jgi:hypothetical protein
MPIIVRCECGKRLSTKDENAGKRAKCPACKREIRVPQPLPDQPGKSAVDAHAVETGTRASKAIESSTGKPRAPLWRMPIAGIGTAIFFVTLFLICGYLTTPRPPAGDHSTSRPSGDDYVAKALKARIANHLAQIRAFETDITLFPKAERRVLDEYLRMNGAGGRGWYESMSRAEREREADKEREKLAKIERFAENMPRDRESVDLLKQATRWYEGDVFDIWEECLQAASVLRRKGTDADARQVLEGSIEVMERFKIIPRGNQSIGHYRWRYCGCRAFGMADHPNLNHRETIDHIVEWRWFADHPVVAKYSPPSDSWDDAAVREIESRMPHSEGGMRSLNRARHWYRGYTLDLWAACERTVEKLRARSVVADPRQIIEGAVKVSEADEKRGYFRERTGRDFDEFTALYERFRLDDGLDHVGAIEAIDNEMAYDFGLDRVRSYFKRDKSQLREACDRASQELKARSVEASPRQIVDGANDFVDGTIPCPARSDFDGFIGLYKHYRADAGLDHERAIEAVVRQVTAKYWSGVDIPELIAACEKTSLELRAKSVIADPQQIVEGAMSFVFLVAPKPDRGNLKAFTDLYIHYRLDAGLGQEAAVGAIVKQWILEHPE